MWTENIRLILYKQCLAWQIIINHLIEPADAGELVEIMKPDKFQGKIMVQAKKDAMNEDKKM